LAPWLLGSLAPWLLGSWPLALGPALFQEADMETCDII
jgi:hypothetical protein